MRFKNIPSLDSMKAKPFDSFDISNGSKVLSRDHANNAIYNTVIGRVECIDFVTDSFISAVENNYAKLFGSIESLAKGIANQSMLYIQSNGMMILLGYSAISSGIEQHTILVTTFLRGKITTAYSVSFHDFTSTSYKFHSLVERIDSSEFSDPYGFAMSFFMVMIFKNYAQVETKQLLSGTKTKLCGCKYLNESLCKINIVSSLWFTNLVKSEAFKVRGHFRLQPKKKNGEWTKELVWIADFQKEGYTRRAGILQKENQPN